MGGNGIRDMATIKYGYFFSWDSMFV